MCKEAQDQTKGYIVKLGQMSNKVNNPKCVKYETYESILIDYIKSVKRKILAAEEFKITDTDTLCYT